MAADMASPQKIQRANSTSSAGTAMSTASMSFAPRFVPKPEPAYISPESAADHVSRLTTADQYDIRSPTASPCGESVTFSDTSLHLVNGFLDALLYNILGKARGTSMGRLRPAIKQVLSGRLARDALQNAEEEMQDLVDEAETTLDQENFRSASRAETWHLEEAFKLMRLRVMVFCKLGLFDDEDEEKFWEEEDNGTPDTSILDGPSAVFLASILEFLSERLLDIAGEAAFERSRRSSNLKTPTIRESREFDQPQRDGLVVEEIDVNKIALNPGFARLWRTWRKSQQHVPAPSAITSGQRLGLSRRSSQDPSTILENGRHITLDDVPEGEVTEHDIAANIPLPISENDIAEIEIPGLAKEYMDDGTEALITPEPTPRQRWIPKRPGSVIFGETDELTPASARPTFKRMRSSSAPMLRMPGAFDYDEAAQNSVIAADATDAEQVENITETDGAIPLASDAVKEKLSEVTPETPDLDHRASFTDASKSAETTEHQEKTGFVAAAIAGAAALVTAAAATVAGTQEEKEEETTTKAAKASPEPLTAKTLEAPVVGRAGSSESLSPRFQEKSPLAGAGIVPTAAALASARARTPEPANLNNGAKVGPTTQMSKIAALRAGFENKAQPTQPVQVVSEPAEVVLPQAVTSASRKIEPEQAIAAAVPAAVVLPSYLSPKATPAPPKLLENEKDLFKVSPIKEPAAETGANSGTSAYADDEYDPFAPSNFNSKPKVAKATAAPIENHSPVSPVSPLEDHEAYTLDENPRTQFYRSMTPTELPPYLQNTNNNSGGNRSSDATQYQTTQAAPLSPVAQQQIDTLYQYRNHPSLKHADELKNQQEQISDFEDEDQPIGVARTSDIRIQSHSPSPIPDQAPFAGANENRLSDSASTNPRTSDVPAAGLAVDNATPDEFVSVKRASAKSLYNARAPSPLSQIRSAASPEPPERTSSRGRDHTATASVASVGRAVGRDQRMSVSSVYSQPEGRSSIENKDPTSSARGQKVPPLQTAFVSQSIAEEPRPSSSTINQKGSRGSIGGVSTHKKELSGEQMGRDFDDFVKSGETVKYTLTPDGLRDNRFWDGPVNGRTSSAAATATDKKLSPQDTKRVSPPTSKAGVPTAPAVQPVVVPITQPAAQPIVQPIAKPLPQQPVAPLVEERAPAPPPKTISQPAPQPVIQPAARAPSPKRKVIPRPSQYRNSANMPLNMRPSTVNTSNPRNPRLVPREARVVTERLSDFADFMRSTAPSNEAQGTPYALKVSSPLGGSNPQLRKSKSRLQAREADTRKTQGSTDLIEFIRQGPNGNGGQNGHTVNGSNGRVPPAAAANTSAPRTTSAMSGPSSTNNRMQSPDMGMGGPSVGRKQYRNKDPYAIDFMDDDDEDDSYGGGGPVNAVNTPSYLRSTSPPVVNNGRVSATSNYGTSPPTNYSGANITSVRSPSAASMNAAMNANSPPNLRGPARMRYETKTAGRTESYGEERPSTAALADFLRSSEPPRTSGMSTGGYNAPASAVSAKKLGRGDSVSSVAGSTDSKRSKRFWRR